MLLGDQADHEVVLVVTRIGHDDVGTLEAGRFENERVAAVAEHRDVGFEKIRHQLRFFGILLDDDHFVILGE